MAQSGGSAPDTQRALIDSLRALPAGELNGVLYAVWPEAFELAQVAVSESVTTDPRADLGRDGRMLLDVIRAAAQAVVEARGGPALFMTAIGGEEDE